MKHKEIIESVKNAIKAKVTGELLLALIAAFPFFGWAFIRPVAFVVVQYLVNVLFERTSLELDRIFIRFEKEQNIGALERAAERARKAFEKKDPDEIKRANEELIDRARRFLDFGRVLEP